MKKIPRRKQLKNKYYKSTVHVVETEQTSPPVCTAETLPEPLAPAEETPREETLLGPIAPTEETPCEETLPGPIAPTEKHLVKKHLQQKNHRTKKTQCVLFLHDTHQTLLY